MLYHTACMQGYVMHTMHHSLFPSPVDRLRISQPHTYGTLTYDLLDTDETRETRELDEAGDSERMVVMRDPLGVY